MISSHCFFFFFVCNLQNSWKHSHTISLHSLKSFIFWFDWTCGSTRAPHVQLDLGGLMVISSLVPAALLKTPALHWYDYSAVHECWPAVLCLRQRTISPSDYPAPYMRRRRCVLRWFLNLQSQKTNGNGDIFWKEMHLPAVCSLEVSHVVFILFRISTSLFLVFLQVPQYWFHVPNPFEFLFSLLDMIHLEHAGPCTDNLKRRYL